MGEQGQCNNLRDVRPLFLLNQVPFDAEVFYRDPREYLSHVMKVTNMSCLTPEGALSGDCDFLSANMYARSLFGTCYLPTIVRLVSQQSYRRGRVGQLEYRENGSWKHHWSCADTKQNAGHRFVFGRPYHNISKGREASCLIECVDRRVLYYRSNRRIAHLDACTGSVLRGLLSGVLIFRD